MITNYNDSFAVSVDLAQITCHARSSSFTVSVLWGFLYTNNIITDIGWYNHSTITPFTFFHIRVIGNNINVYFVIFSFIKCRNSTSYVTYSRQYECFLIVQNTPRLNTFSIDVYKRSDFQIPFTCIRNRVHVTF